MSQNDSVKRNHSVKRNLLDILKPFKNYLSFAINSYNFLAGNENLKI